MEGGVSGFWSLPYPIPSPIMELTCSGPVTRSIHCRNTGNRKNLVVTSCGGSGRESVQYKAMGNPVMHNKVETKTSYI